MSEVTTTDLYEVTMALSYLREDMRAPATFSLFVRDLPPGRGFLVAAGLEPALDFLSRFRVGRADLLEFSEVLRRPVEDLEPLHGLSFDGQVRAVPEGRLVLAGEPLLEVTAPLPQAQLVETYLLSLVCHQTAVASKAARCVLAAAGRPLVDFSLRRAHGPEAGAQAARLGALVGFAGTSNVAAARRYGITAAGTMAHAYVEAFASEEQAFRAFARTHPGPVTFLVDTYDTDRGVATAARVLKDLGLGAGCAIRLDSGDLGAQARRARAALDAAGLGEVRIIVSGGLDEYAVAGLVREDAPVDAYAVGTKVGTAADAPYLDAAYKLVEYDGRPVMKLSSTTWTAPGPKQVFRGPGLRDVVGLANEAPPEGTEPLLRTVMRGGLRTDPPDTLAAARARFETDLAALPVEARRIDGPVAPVPAASTRLTALTAVVRHRLEARTGVTGRTPPAGPAGLTGRGGPEGPTDPSGPRGRAGPG
ncbi:nicotinate phosphoribosyltransferase [Streptomyces sp. NPDC053493]|uniref:nicotinate phosphoribosyltransferase n=1 Tax=Streptomyces sp. NPDC053493 TaxID=3365705 RepID=UPI0037D41AEE